MDYNICISEKFAPGRERSKRRFSQDRSQTGGGISMHPVDIRISKSATCRNINRLMKEKGWGVHDLQEACGFEQPQAVYKWLKGQSLPSIDSLLVLARLFHTQLEDILVFEGKIIPFPAESKDSRSSARRGA
jgi:DNA-binding XRE family transcriptional regulator